MRLLCVGLILVGSMELAQASSLKLLRSSWVRNLVMVGTIAMLALPLPYVDAAPDKEEIKDAEIVETQSPQGEWRAVFAGSHAPFLAVLNLQSDFTDDRRLSTEHLLYLGQSRDDSAVFITMRDVAIDFLHHDSSPNKGDNRYILWSWDNLVQDEVAIEPFYTFSLTQLAYYDFVVLKIAGLDLSNDFVPVQLATFPASGTPIVHLSYLFDGGLLVDRPPPLADTDENPDFNNDPNDDDAIQGLPQARAEPPPPPPAEDLPEPPPVGNINTTTPPPELSASLYWRRCKAGMLDQATQVGTFDCLPYRDILQGSVVFNARTGTAVGFYFYRFEGEGKKIIHRASVAGFAPQLLDYIEENFTVSPRGKLSTSWGALKNE